MEKPGLFLIRQIPYCARRFDRRNRATKFVREQFHPLRCLQRPAELLVETAIARARHAGIERRAHDGVARIAQNDLFGGGFGLAILMNRVHRVGFGVIPFAPVKNQVR